MKTLMVLIQILLVALFLVTCQDQTDQLTAPEENADGTMVLRKAAVIDLHEYFPFDEVLSGECLGQDLHFQGGFDQYTHTVLDGNGGFHSRISWEFNNMTVTSTSTSDSWTPKYLDHAIIQGKIGEIFTESGHGFYTANQPGPDLREHWILHATVNANGELTVSKETIRMECFGH